MKKKGRKGKIWFFVVAILILFLAYSTFAGITTRYGDTETEVVKSASEIRFGIDIRGGVDVTFVPDNDEVVATPEQMAAAQEVMEQRLISLGITDYEIYKDVDKGRIILRFPWQAEETEFDPETAIQELSTTAVLTFREGNERDETTGEPIGVTAENIILQGSDIQSAVARYGQVSSGTNENFVLLTLTPEGQRKFTEATTRLAATPDSVISIWLDDYVISAPTVNAAITDNTAIISGNFTAESASSLANTINSGALPFAMRAESYSTISPTLGAQSLQAMVLAGIVAFILVVGFMIFNYRLPGFVSSISLLGQLAATIAIISGYFAVFPSFTLTLPGIAGIILSIGMGVDANVITGARIREELRTGKKLDAAIQGGFEHGLAPIIDGNVTVIIVAVILMGAFGPTDSIWAKVTWPFFNWFGVSTAGAIYSFGFTLFIGVLLNFVFGVFCTRVMLKSISKFKMFRNPVLYGGLKEGQEPKEDKPFNIVGHRKVFFSLSSILIVAIIVVSFIFGVKLDVQFSGGAIVTYSYSTDFNLDEATDVVSATLGSDVSLQEGENTATGGKTLTITLPGTDTIEAEKLDTLTAALNSAFPSSMTTEDAEVQNFEQLSVNNVDATMGREFLFKSIVAVVVAMLLILVYIAFRFRKIGGWVGGFTAIVALVHDLIVIYGVFVISQIPLNGNFIAALLTILGYSINDTVVIYDRVRENRSLFGRRMPFGKLVNLSINQSLKRSVNTTVTTLMALACVCIFAIVYGLNDIFTFAFPLMIGMVSGVYSTICIAGPLWVVIENHRKKKKNGKGEKEDIVLEAKEKKAIAAGKDTKGKKGEKAVSSSKSTEDKEAIDNGDDESAKDKKETKTVKTSTSAKKTGKAKGTDDEEEDKEQEGQPKAKKTAEKAKTSAAKVAVTAQKPQKAEAETTKDEEKAKEKKKTPAKKTAAKKQAPSAKAQVPKVSTEEKEVTKEEKKAPAKKPAPQKSAPAKKEEASEAVAELESTQEETKEKPNKNEDAES